MNERDVDGYLACCADDIKLRTPWAAVAGVYEGPEAIRRFFADLQDWAPDFRLTIDRVEPIGGTRVLVFLRASLIEEDADAGDLATGEVVHGRGGKILRGRGVAQSAAHGNGWKPARTPARDQALEAVGLRE